MDKNLKEQYFDEDKTESINLREQIELYLIHWKWFALGVFLMLVGAYLFLRYSTPVYKATSVIMLKDEYRGGAANELSVFSDLGVLKGTKDNAENEMEILRSRTLSEKVVEKLQLNISYLKDGKIKSSDLYKNSPVNIDVVDLTEESKLYTSLRLEVKGIDNNNYHLFFQEKKIDEYKYGDTIVNNLGKFVINKDKENFPNEGFNITIILQSIKKTAQSYRAQMQINPLGKYTSVLELTMLHSNKEKAEDYLNTLVELYNSEGIADRRFVSENTLEFLSKRLDVLADELEEVESEAEKFKKENRITDILTETKVWVENASEFEKKYIDINNRIEIIDNVITGFIDEDTKGKSFPMLDALTSDPSLATAIEEHNRQILYRNSLARSAGPENSKIKQLDLQIEAYKKAIRGNLTQLKSNLLITRAEINKQRGSLSGRIGSIPTLEKEFKGIGRQQGVKNALYLYLLQKREETEISIVATAPNAKIIDYAQSSDAPVSPKRNMIYLAALVLGILIPFAIIYLINLMDTKVKSRFDVEKLLTVPFLGDVPHSESNEEIIKPESRSGSAEALRIIRTNMEFILSQVPKDRAKTVFITSTLPKEGKTFVAVNLAGTFALSGKKTLLIGMDIRNPKLSDYLKLPSKGLTSYLASNDVDLDSIIVKQEGYKEFYVMPPGIIPPNPAELLMSTKIAEMFEYLKAKFDYIIVDTAPVSLVTDTLLIAQNADAFVYVIRENYLDKRMLHIPQKLYKEKKLPNMSVLLNDTYSRKGYGFGYGYGYGYGIEEEKKPWYKKFFSFGK
ncbi:MAG: polysaccharide biosynthesis tyrosine autokinase [Flavobacteriaceae bacterium]